MKKLVIIFSVILAIGYYFLFFVPSPKKSEEIHFHAGFLVYVDSTLQDFSDSKYMHIEPCTDEKMPRKEPARNASSIADAGGDQLEKAHLHNNVGDVVHVHRVKTLWQDLFKNINFPIPQNKPLSGFINGVKTNNILNSAINPYDSVLIIIGDDKNIDKSQSVTREYIKGIEEKTESC